MSKEFPFLADIKREFPHRPDRPVHGMVHVMGNRVKLTLLVQV